ncbi:MAG: PilN domain-containing protein [Solirubrobacterales bacterium]
MRPVNLIPTEERRGERRPLRGGPLAYVIVGALALAVIGVAVLVVTGNQISERKADVTQLESETAAVEAEAQALAAYTQFHGTAQARVATVSSLADSRFDWERVMRELALVFPDDVWLTNLTATASPAVAPENAASVSLRSGVAGPALEIIGCGRSQDAVAGFVQVLKDIDGVTRVGLQGSSLGETSGGGGSSAASTCQTRGFIAQFQLVVGFDAAPVSAEASSGEVAVQAAPPAAEEAAEGEG